MKLLDKFLKFLERIGLIKKKEGENKELESEKDNKKILVLESLDDTEYKFGDIVIANRFENEQEKDNIPLGHRDGPFIVIGKAKGKILALYATGAIPTDYSYRYRNLLLKTTDYYDTLEKDTFVCTNRCYLLADSDIKETIGHLNENDEIGLNKRIGIVTDKKEYGSYALPYKKVELSVGDVIKRDNNMYVVIGLSEGVYECLQIKKGTNGYRIALDGVDYVPVYKEIIKIIDVSEYNRVNVIPDNMIIGIQKDRKDYLDFMARDGIIGRGSVITLGDRYFYVNGELGDTFNGFEILKTEHSKMAKIKVGTETFYTNFSNLIQFYKKEHEYSFYKNAWPFEMQNIKDEKKSYTKKHSPRKSRLSKTKRARIRKSNEYKANITSGALVEEGLSMKRYIVITRQDKKIVVLNLKNYEEFNYVLEEKSVDEVSFVSLFHPIVFNELLKELVKKKNNKKNKLNVESIKRLIKE